MMSVLMCMKKNSFIYKRGMLCGTPHKLNISELFAIDRIPILLYIKNIYDSEELLISTYAKMYRFDS